MIRNKKALRCIAIFLLLNTLQFIFQPTIAWALTSGPSQPEFSGYEEVGNTDMVNLLTGDFTYNIPLLEVPGPEGGFAIPLSYHAGIGPEHQASWVGLGWSLTPGAICRSINQYPDDFSGETVSTTMFSPGSYGYSLNFYIGKYTWDSEKGNGGTIGTGALLKVGLGSQRKETSVLGIDGKKKTDAEWGAQIGMAVVTVVATVATYGAYGMAAVATQQAVGVAIGAGMETVMSAGSDNMNLTYENSWSYETKRVNVHKKKWKYWLDQTKTEKTVGPLYFQDIANYQNGWYNKYNRKWSGSYGNDACAENANNLVFDNGAASDMHMNTDGGPIESVMNPLSIAYDSYNITGSGVSGNIQPIRYEVGNLSFPKKVSQDYYSSHIVPYLNYKVKYRYLGDHANGYKHHIGNTSSGSLPNNAQFGVSPVYTKCLTSVPGKLLVDNNRIHWVLQDNSLYDATKRIEADRYGFKNNKLIQGSNIEWYSNQEILDATSNGAIAKGFIDFMSATERNTFRNSLPASTKSKGIGGYSVTRQDGMTYHYALPVYNKEQTTHAEDLSGQSGNYINTTNSNWFAYSWLLTAITGPDFVDRGEIGRIDDADWGNWVKMDYGQFASNYKWRAPYWGDYIPEGNIRSNTYGTKETYYLNTIRTRSHTAMFVKDVRLDGRSHFNLADVNSKPSSSLKLNEIIVLSNVDYDGLVNSGMLTMNSNANNTSLANGDTYNNVYDRYDISNSARTLINQSQIKKIRFNYDHHPTDPATDPEGITDQYELCKKTCNSFFSPINPERADPYTNRFGKLTLQGVSVLGRNDEKLLPDYIFYYGTNSNPVNNPDYHLDKWDGWGMYKGDAGSHEASWIDKDGAAWSLTKITTPLGGTVEVSYERDTYSSISGNVINENFPNLVVNTNGGPGVNKISAPVGVELDDYYNVGQSIYVIAKIGYYYWISSTAPCQAGEEMEVFSFSISSIQGNIMYINENMASTILANSEDNIPDYRAQCGSIFTINDVQVHPLSVPPVTRKYGGDIRVSQIRTSDGVNIYRTNYVYTQDGTPSGQTSGVVAQEPDHIKKINYPFYDLYDYPSTPVLYNKVTVYNGKLSTWDDYNSGTEYIFCVPSSNMVTKHTPYTIFNQSEAYYDLNYDYYIYLYNYMSNFVVDVNTAKIGRLESIRNFDKSNTSLLTTTLGYRNDLDLGLFTEGSVMADMTYTYGTNMHFHHKFIRTTKRYFSNILESQTTTQGNITEKTTNINFDFYTGAIIEKEYTNSLGVKYRSVTVPAYERYDFMGSKALSPKNKNMMSQVAAEYLYKNTNGWATQSATLSNVVTGGITTYTMNLGSFILPPTYRTGYWAGIYVTIGGVSTYITPQITAIDPSRKSFSFIWSTGLNNPSSLGYVPMQPVNVGIQTWSNQWNERTYDATPMVYSNTLIADNISTLAADETVWRKKANYVWKSPLLNQDGTYQNYVDYDWSPNAVQHPNWQKTKEVVNYDQYSRPLESQDINGNYSAIKYGYDLQLPLSSAQNAKYVEIAYSGAEDLNTVGTTGYFGGEVFRNSGVIDNTYAHTGKNSLRVDNGQYGFIYKAKIESSGVELNKKYRASVWVYDNGNVDAKLYYHLQTSAGVNTSTPNEGNVSVSTANSVIKMGKWKLLNLDINLTGSYNGYLLTIGCTNPVATPAYFDDFRFYPLNTSMPCNVYDAQTGLKTHMLDGDGFYVRYAYDTKGRVIGIYKETVKGEIKMKQFDYNYAGGN